MADVKITTVDKNGVEETKTEAPVAKVKAENLLTPSQIEALIKSKQKSGV